jgi:3-phenylpropionate/cinnamic acid dioxygenase small subunit
VAATAALEARIQTLEDIEAIKRLKFRYADLVDSQQWLEVMNCFADDASGDYGPIGNYPTRKDLERFFFDIVPNVLPFTLHYVTNPSIELVDSERARGSWYFNVAATYAPTNKAIYLAGRYNDEYVKRDGDWLYQRIVLDVFYSTDYDQGWAQQRWNLPGPVVVREAGNRKV